MVGQNRDECVPEDRRRRPRNNVRLVFRPTGISLSPPTVRALIEDGLARLIASRIVNQSKTVFGPGTCPKLATTPLSPVRITPPGIVKMQLGRSPKAITRVK